MRQRPLAGTASNSPSRSGPEFERPDMLRSGQDGPDGEPRFISSLACPRTSRASSCRLHGSRPVTGPAHSPTRLSFPAEVQGCGGGKTRACAGAAQRNTDSEPRPQRWGNEPKLRRITSEQERPPCVPGRVRRVTILIPLILSAEYDALRASGDAFASELAAQTCWSRTKIYQEPGADFLAGQRHLQWPPGSTASLPDFAPWEESMKLDRIFGDSPLADGTVRFVLTPD